ncbi:IclR family transcriptional regulator [Microlunatus ginsengisoli]|uniref:IclR family transcriptional regulator n=1 Tax=Microlunatus ginsengisoli TaxID=363863 RepID=A0ABP7AIN6_9ACTN
MTRSLAILTLLADAAGEPLGLADIARGIGAAKSSTSNLCQALEEGEMISRTPRGYVLGRRNVELGGAYIAQFNQMREFYAFCETAPLLSHEVVQIAMLQGTDAVYLARHEGRAPMRLTASIGSRYPAAPTAVGNALLTTLGDAEIIDRFRGAQHFPQLTERSVRTVPALLAKIKAARERGYAIDDNEVHPGIYGLAVPLPPWMSGDQPLAMGTSLMASAATPDFVAAIVAELRDGVRRLTNPLYRAALASG